MKRRKLSTPAEKPDAQRGRTKVRFAVNYCLDPVKVAISRLSDSEFDHMDRSELISIVRSSGLNHMCHECDAHLEFLDDQHLRMLACQARSICQRATHSAYIEHGKPSPFLCHVALN